MNLPRVATTRGYARVRSRETRCSPRGVQVEVCYCESSCDNSFNYFKVRIIPWKSLKLGCGFSGFVWKWAILPQWLSKWETWLLTIRFWGTIWDKNMSWQQNNCSCGSQHVMEFYHVWPIQLCDTVVNFVKTGVLLYCAQTVDSCKAPSFAGLD
jgi:hypothetical protein